MVVKNMFNRLNFTVMKTKSIFLIVLIFASQISFAQHTYIHETDEGDCRQNYHSVVSSDGCIIVDEDLFEGETGGTDLGIRFLKISPNEGVINSLFIEDVQMSYKTCLLAKNPSVPDENAYLYITSNDEGNSLKVIKFSDDMELISRESKPLPIEGDMKIIRYYMDRDGDILASWRDIASDTCTCWFGRFGLDGTLKSMSEPIQITGVLPVSHPFFRLDDESQRIGYLAYDYHTLPNGSHNTNCHLFIYIIDENMQLVEIKTIEKLGGYLIQPEEHMSVIELGDDGFALMCRREDFYSTVFHRAIGKYDKNCNLQKVHDISGVANWVAPQPMSYDKNNGKLYVIWYDNSDFSATGEMVHVRCLDENMNMMWDKAFIKGCEWSVVNGSNVLESGEIALSGCMSYKGCSYYDSYVFASFVDGYDNVEENSIDNPFTVYPNPAKDIVNINFDENSTCNSIEIYAIDGRLVKSQNFNFSTIDISNLNPGVYVMKLRMSDGKEFSERIVKK